MPADVPLGADNLSQIVIKDIIPPHVDKVLGFADPETEAKFGQIDMSPHAANNISNLSLAHLEDEIGGFLVGWEEDGVRHIADTLVHIPENPQVGQFPIIDGENFMLHALEGMRENPAYEGHNLEVLGWWHTHPPEMRAADGSIIPAMTPTPTGGLLEGRAATGDLGVTEYFSRRFGKPQEMLIVQTSRRDQPVEFALWRWDDTEGAEQAYYQKGIRLGSNDALQNVEYWKLAEGGDVARPFRTREQDIIHVTLEEEGQPINLDNIIQVTLGEPQHDAGEPIEVPVEDATSNNGLEITLLDQQSGEDVELSVRDLYKPGIKGQIAYSIDKIRNSPEKLKTLKQQVMEIIKSPWGATSDIRITAEDILREIQTVDDIAN